MKVVAEGITAQWDVMSGTPCIQGRRIPPFIVFGYFMRGRSVTWIARQYGLKEKQVQDAIRYEYTMRLAGKRRTRARKPMSGTKEEGE